MPFQISAKEYAEGGQYLSVEMVLLVSCWISLSSFDFYLHKFKNKNIRRL
jgi:hypothetical protein